MKSNDICHAPSYEIPTMRPAPRPTWHEKGSTWYYADPDLKVLGWVTPAPNANFHAQAENLHFGTYLALPAAQKAVEGYFRGEVSA